MLRPDVALIGKMGAGKDYAADLLAKYGGYVKLPLARALKMDVAAIHGITLEELEANKGEYRKELQEIGVGKREEFGKNYWLVRWMELRATIPAPVAIPDTRFINEAEFFMGRGAYVVKIYCPEDIRLYRLEKLYGFGSVTPDILNHASEQEIDRCPKHYTVWGNSSPDTILKNMLVGLIQHYPIPTKELI